MSYNLSFVPSPARRFDSLVRTFKIFVPGDDGYRHFPYTKHEIALLFFQ